MPNEIVYDTVPCPNEIDYETDSGLAPGKLGHQSDPETSKQSLSAYSPIMKSDIERKRGLRETNSEKEIQRRRDCERQTETNLKQETGRRQTKRQ